MRRTAGQAECGRGLRLLEQYPEGERREIREIYRRKGFRGGILERIVEMITRDRDLWVETMLVEELDMQKVKDRPWRSAFTTFFAFAGFGFIPLLPFVVPLLPGRDLFLVRGGLTSTAFLVLGILKGLALRRSPLRSGLQTLLVGGIAAGPAYSAGAVLHAVFGVNPG